MFTRVKPDMDFVSREREVLKFWTDNGVMEESFKPREGRPRFTFYDGPPTANGRPHIGHVETRAFKDLIPRYKAMKGYDVLRKAGWDTHGLPVELEVEKALGLNGKPQIEEYGIEPFIHKCKESVFVYKEEWERMSERVGFWADMRSPYVTYENDYIESVWWSLKTLADKGLLYKGHRVVPYCPRCGTALSSHEVAQGYKDVTDESAYVKFPVKGEDGAYLLAWTTTPWTLPSNVALVVNAAEDYARARVGESTYILAAALLDSVLGEGAYEVTERFKGERLRGMEYERIYPYAGDVKERAWYVVCDDYVTLSDGTGIVHCAPSFGEDDARVGRLFGLPFVQLVNTEGRFVTGTGFMEGDFVKDADPKILRDLKERALLLKKAKYEHSYPFCWRCDTPLIYYARESWFIKVTALKEELRASNASVDWYPDNVRDGRMGDFIDNLIDWNLSRERYWGTPLPVWECGCGHMHVVGSIKELRDMGRNVPADLELHKPYIDEVLLTCPKCAQAMRRVPEVIDCWYDAGSMPFAQWHYPFENKDVFERRFPADFISEAVDQTRGWFYALLAISTIVFGDAPFKTCLVLGHVNDKDGYKMSKHKGNVMDPWEVLDKEGADAVRWFFYVCGAPWLPKRFYHEAVGEAQRKFLGTLLNVYAFFTLYASIDGFDPRAHALDTARLGLMDRWVLSRLNAVVRDVDAALEGYRVTEAARALADFVDEASNWYLRRCRERFWASGMEEDKVCAYMTLYTVLTTLARLIAPFTPFMAESMYQNLVRGVDESAPLSVHLCDFPAWDAAPIDEALERDMDLTLRCVALGRACRNTANIKNRQPLPALYIVSGGEAPPEEYARIIAEELNVKKVEFIKDAGAFTAYALKPQLRTLGKKYGKLVPKIGEALAAMDGGEALKAFEAGGLLSFEVEGARVELAQEDVIVNAAHREGYVAQTERALTVALDTSITEELRDEGFVREAVSKLQTMRRDAGYEVTDRIRVWYDASPALAPVLDAARDGIAADVLAQSVERAAHSLAPGDAYAREWDINGENAVFAIRKV